MLTGRATDTALIAAVPLRLGAPAGPTWHAAKTTECGGLCTIGRAGPVLATITDDGFTVEPMEPGARCTPASVAAHMLYENADPYLMREPSGCLDTSRAVYQAVNDRVVRVTGSSFNELPYTNKLEGAVLAGYRSALFAGIRDPFVLGDVVAWTERLREVLTRQAARTLGLAPESFRIDMRRYGFDAVMGDNEPLREVSPQEVGLLLTFTAADQATASTLAKLSDPTVLHFPIARWDAMATFAFPFSPAEFDLGPYYRFVLNHSVHVDDPLELCRVEFSDVER